MSDPAPLAPPRPGRRSRVDVLAAVGLALAATAAVALTIGDVGLTYDEPVYFNSHTRMREWMAVLLGLNEGPAQHSALDPRTLEVLWRYEVEENRHPPMIGYVANLSWWTSRAVSRALTGAPVEEAWAYRWSSAVLFGVLVGLLYAAARREWGRAAGVGAALSLVLMPRVFGHAHAAATETPSMVLWFLCYVAFRGLAPADRSRRAPIGRGILFGAVLGLSLLTKFTNWLVVVPLGVWAWRFRNGVRWSWLWLPAAVAAAVAFGLNPRWWPSPISAVYNFVEGSLTREQSGGLPTYFLGRTYRFALPWYNAPLLTAATTPVLVLAAFVVGLAVVCRRRLRSELGAFSVVTVAFFWIVRALPAAPGHDGIRLFLPMFPFVAALAGAGMAWLAGITRRPRAAAVAIIGLTTLSAGYQLIRIHPYHLAYYGEAVGGPAGAQRLGFETTYWYDAATGEFLDLLNERLPPKARVFGIPGWPTLAYWQAQGRLRDDVQFPERPEEIETVEFVILLCRQGKFDPQYANVPRPRWCTVETVWHWYRTFDRQWLTFAPRYGVPLIIVVRVEPTGLLLD